MTKLKKMFYYFLSFSMILSSGCSLMPKEEELPTAPIKEPYHAKEYIKTQVVCGDIIETVTIPAVFRASKIENIKFPEGNKRLEEVFVKAGDTVKIGDLVATLETGNLEERIRDLSNEIELLSLGLKQEKEMMQLTSLSRNSREIEESIYIKKKRLEEWIQEKETCEIRAGIEGIVAYALDLNTELKSTKDVTILTILDEKSCYYEVDSQYGSYFEGEDFVTIATNRGEYEGELYVPSETFVEGSENNIYFKLLIPDFDIPIGSKGSIVRTINKREQVLIIPSDGVITTADGYYVYIEETDRFKSLKKIEVGLVADGKAEVLNGLSEGDSIILE